MHVVFATDSNGTYRVSDNLSWGQAVAAWTRLDDCRRAGLMPHIKHFEVRSNADQQPRFKNARLNTKILRAVFTHSRGFSDGKYYSGAEKAAREAWKLFAPRFRSHYDKTFVGDNERRTGVQGSGGWYYYPNGQTVAQGLNALAKVCIAKGLIVQGINGRWYVLDHDLDTADLFHREVAA